ncbi:leukocyte immunoglobulin-like receptor subfamily A member 6 isoform X2 [Cavia porcellus]|uniref:leukocyte immunoglobulin-like receptor subfamily A member 6 isoform X2 n=1 Tax=Cavia porcellus TaxID=10141 RepID=UPI000C87896F|nr:leukocyte immunoglobulin-like receptor subfamily A member 6 isoform X2 [Cavia porcellus]
MTATLTALLCIGLNLGTRIQVQSGTLPKPMLGSRSGSVIPQGKPVTLWCEWTLGAQECGLYKKGSQEPWIKNTSLELKNSALFFISSMTQQHAGLHRCYYRVPSGLSEGSEPLELVVTGIYSKPSLSALPSLVVNPGGSVTLQCGSQLGFDRFILTKEGGDKHSWTQDSQKDSSGQFQALFPVDPVTPSHRWSFRCYGCYWNQPQVWSEPSDPLELHISGSLPKPKLQAQPGSVIPWRSPVTLWCEGTLEAQQYYVFREGSPAFSETKMSPGPRNKAMFFIPSMKEDDAGRYHCYYHSTEGWSELSDALELVVTGVYSRPSLSALFGPVVTSGGNMTLKCVSWQQFDRFILTKEGGDKLSWTLNSQRGPSGQVHALFTVSPVIPRQRWMFRCYGCYNTNIQVWSKPSDVMEPLVSGGPEDQPLTFTEPGSQDDSTPSPSLQGNLEVVIGVSVVSSLLLLLILLLFVYWCQERSWKADSTKKNTEPEDRMELDTQSSSNENPQRVTYAQVKHSAPRKIRTSCPSALSGQLLDTKLGQAEEDRLMDTQDRALPAGSSVYTSLMPTRPGAIPEDTTQRPPEILGPFETHLTSLCVGNKTRDS